jgi:transposase
MNRATTFDSLNWEDLVGVALAQAEAIERQAKEIAALRGEIVELRAKLDRPPKTPDNSSIPPSRGMKNTTEFVKNRRKKKAHPGAHRPLSPNPTHRRDILADTCGHCGADVSSSPQEPCEVYDRIEIPPIAPEITRVSLNGGVCPCCARRFKAEAPAGLEPGSPFGPNLRAFVFYLRFTQGVGFERLSRLMRDLFGLSISEGALVNILRSARKGFAAAGSAIRAKLLSGGVICSDETGLRVNKRSWWLWVFHHGQNAFFLTHPRRVPRTRLSSFSATSARTHGSPTATAPRPAGPRKSSKSASPISCATRNMSSTRATASSPRLFATSSAWRATRRSGATSGTRPRSTSIDAASKPNLTGSWP